MVTVNLLPPLRLGPLFDVEAHGWRRYAPRRPWWPALPFLPLAAPVMLGAMALNGLARRVFPGGAA
ncbi:MAG: hypothetical protein AB2A00_02295 [Myxococcota bacterium]